MREPITGRWWAESDRAGADLVRTVRWLREQDAQRIAAMKRSVSLYLNRPLRGLDVWNYHVTSALDERVRIGLARSIVDTVHAQMTKTLPRTTPITEGGSWTMQRSARRLETFIDGAKYRSRWGVILPALVRDAMVVGTGIAKVSGVVRDDGEDGQVGRVLIERVLPWDVVVDHAEAVHAAPRHIYQVSVVDRRVAMRLFPNAAEQIESRGRHPAPTDGPARDTHADQVTVMEGWRLPSAPHAGDGAHVVAVDGVDAAVYREEWTRDVHPFAVLRWGDPVAGFWGTSMVDEIAGIHAEVNDLIQREQAIIAQTGRPIIVHSLGNAGDLVMDDSLGVPVFSVPGDVNADIRIHNPPALNGELGRSRQELLQLGYQMSGVSQLSAGAMKPAGLDSRVALREFRDIEAERFVHQQQRIESVDLDVSRLVVREAQALDEKGVLVEVSAKTRRRRRHVIERIQWSEIDLDEDSYELQAFPTSSLPRHPAGRLAMVEQLIGAGFIGRDDALRLLEFPDVDQVMSEQLAPYHLVLDVIETIMEDGRFVPPIPEQDLGLTRRVVSLAILRYTLDEAPEERIEMLRRYSVLVDQMMERAMQSQAVAQPATVAQQGQQQMPPMAADQMMAAQMPQEA